MFKIDVSAAEWAYAESFFQDPENSHLVVCDRKESAGKIKHKFIRTENGQIFALNNKHQYLGEGYSAKVKVAQLKNGENYIVKIMGDTGDPNALELMATEKEIDTRIGYQAGSADRQYQQEGRGSNVFLGNEIIGKQYHFKKLFEGAELFSTIPDSCDETAEKKDCNPLECIELGIRMIESVHALHLQNVIHRDLKYENFIVNFNGPNGDIIVNEIDHGLSKTCADRSKTYKTDRPCGTPLTTSPEMYAGEYSQKSDVYSLGAMLMGAPPMYPGEDCLEYGLFNGFYWDAYSYFEKKAIGEPVVLETMALLIQMADRTPQKRPELPEVIAKLKKLYNVVYLELGDPEKPSKFAAAPSPALIYGFKKPTLQKATSEECLRPVHEEHQCFTRTCSAC